MGNKSFKVRIARIVDILLLKDELRAIDGFEVKAQGSTPLNSLLEGYIISDECYCAFIKEGIIGIFGFKKSMHSIWFLGSKLSESVPKEWITTAKYYINKWLKETPILTNRVYWRNEVHKRWLKRMGAVFSAPYLINGEYFQDFYIIKGE